MSATETDLKHLSYSQLSEFERCPALWANRDVAPETANRPRDVGREVHNTIERYFRALVETEGDRDAAAYAALVELGSNASEHFEEVKEIFERWQKRDTIRVEDLFSIEDYYARRLEGVPVPIVGYVDRVYLEGDLHVIRDEKTGWASKVKPDHEFQGDLMCWLFRGQYPGAKVCSEVAFARTGVVKRREFDDEREAATAKRILADYNKLAAARESGTFARTPGDHCEYCPVVVDCAARTALELQGLIVTTPETAADALKGAVIYAAASKRLTTSLKGYVDAQGPLETEGAKAYYRTTTSVAIKDVAEFAQILGLDAVQYLVVDGRKNKKLLKDPRVAGLFVPTPGKTSFKIEALKVDDPDAPADEEVDDGE